MDNSTAIQPGTVALEPPSTVLNPQTIEHISGGGKTAVTEKDDIGSIESVLEAELADLKAADKAAKPEPEGGKEKVEAKDDKTKADAKDEDKPAKARAEDGKFAKAEKAEDQPEDAKADKGAPAKVAAGQEASERRTSEGRHPEPPARFLPDARAKWANTPNEVKAEVHRVAQEYEQENQQFKASHERYTQLKDFDELAKSNGRDLRESLAKVNEIENSLQRNVIGGLDAVLREVGPRRADGSPITIMDVAQYLTQNPQAYQQQAAQHMPQPQAQPAQQQENPEIKRLTEQVNALVANQTILPVVEKFSEGKPDFEALSETITSILADGVVDRLYGTGLSLEQRLAEAYRMAGGQAPSSRSDSEPSAAHSEATPERLVNPDAGKKSVRGAPADGDDTSGEEPESDISDLLRKELRKQMRGGVA